MRRHLLAMGLMGVFSLAARAAEEPPTQWIDPTTGHKIVRLSREPGSASLYFNQNAYTPDGKKLIITTPTGISTITLATGDIEKVVEGVIGPVGETRNVANRISIIVVGHQTGDVYYIKNRVLYATNCNTHATREISKITFRGGLSTLNADETLLAGAMNEGTPIGGDQTAPDSTLHIGDPVMGADGKPLNKADAKEVMMDRRLNQHIPMVLFTIDTKTGEMKTIYKSTDWLNHLQFSPTDPSVLMFCHEGPWHKVDRIWTIKTDGTALTKIHTRTLEMEIAGHEFWAADGKTLWYDLQTPRGEDFWVAGYELATGTRTWYHMDRDEWSVHFNVSPDGRMFAGDGGDSEMVARAKDGKYIYLFRPEMVPNHGVVTEEKGLIKTGVFRAEKLVDMSKHDYKLEPNVTFTPDMKWLVFRTNMFGPTQVLAVEIARSEIAKSAGTQPAK